MDIYTTSLNANKRLITDWRMIREFSIESHSRPRIAREVREVVVLCELQGMSYEEAAGGEVA